MCGFTGFWSSGGRRDAVTIATAMANCIIHRGPDDTSVWADTEVGVAIAHRRLSIVDLSAGDGQLSVSASGRWVIGYAGEIYNHLELRKQLEVGRAAPVWRGISDTETLLAAIEAWGLVETLKRCAGMFAMALWDRKERALWLARDRIGEKPLYYGWQGDTFLFGSQLKALSSHPAFNAAVDRGALALLLRQNYVPSPYSIYAGIHKLPPGTWLKLSAGQRDVQPVTWWSLAEAAERGTGNSYSGSDRQAVDALEGHLGNAVCGQMATDVPLGALLSGGIDSSLIASLMQANSRRPVRTFTIGFDEKAYDEATHARAIAGYLGTEHTEMRLSANDALDLVPQLPSMYDEPFADSSQLPTHLVMKLARQHVAVALSGDAGDEFFAGYNRYVLAPEVWNRLGWMPAWLRANLSRIAAHLPSVVLDRLGTTQSRNKMEKLARVLSARKLRDIDDLYCGLVSEWPDPAAMVVDGHIPPNLLDERDRWPQLSDPVARMMALDGLTYLPDDILVKVDRAAMAASLETRAPFLDRDVMEFAWSLPMSMKLRDGKGKWILRQLLDRHIPRELIDRPKMGFGIPLDEWLRGPLREWAEDLLAEDRLRREGYFDPKPIRETWRRHVRGEASFGHRLWSVLMFQAWLEQQGV